MGVRGAVGVCGSAWACVGLWVCAGVRGRAWGCGTVTGSSQPRGYVSETASVSPRPENVRREHVPLNPSVSWALFLLFLYFVSLSCLLGQASWVLLYYFPLKKRMSFQVYLLILEFVFYYFFFHSYPPLCP